MHLARSRAWATSTKTVKPNSCHRQNTTSHISALVSFSGKGWSDNVITKWLQTSNTVLHSHAFRATDNLIDAISETAGKVAIRASLGNQVPHAGVSSLEELRWLNYNSADQSGWQCNRKKILTTPCKQAAPGTYGDWWQGKSLNTWIHIGTTRKCNRSFTYLYLLKIIHN